MYVCVCMDVLYACQLTSILSLYTGTQYTVMCTDNRTITSLCTKCTMDNYKCFGTTTYTLSSVQTLSWFINIVHWSSENCFPHDYYVKCHTYTQSRYVCIYCIGFFCIHIIYVYVQLPHGVLLLTSYFTPPLIYPGEREGGRHDSPLSSVHGWEGEGRNRI